MLKIETFVEQPGLEGFGLSVFEGKAPQDAIIPSQPVIDVAEEVIAVFVKLVVISVATIVGTELLVYPSPDGIPAFQTLPFHVIFLSNTAIKVGHSPEVIKQ